MRDEYIADKEIYKKHRIEIVADQSPENPREMWDNLGIIAYSHRNYKIGDEEINTNEFDSTEEIIKWLKKEKGAVAILPVYAYEHGGIALSTGRGSQFSDRWDSGQVGYIYTTKEKIKEFLGKDIKKLNPQMRKRVEKMLEQEIETLDDYFQGQVWCFRVYDDAEGEGEMIESVCGFYGDTGDALQDAKSTVDWIVKKAQEDRAKQREGFKGAWKGYPEDFTEPTKKVPEIDYWEE
jgi:hypothetical protein